MVCQKKSQVQGLASPLPLLHTQEPGQCPGWGTGISRASTCCPRLFPGWPWQGLSLASWVISRLHISLLRATITKYHKLGGSDNRNVLSQFWRLEVWDQGVSRVGNFWGIWESVPCLLPSFRWLTDNLMSHSLNHPDLWLHFYMASSPVDV